MRSSKNVILIHYGSPLDVPLNLISDLKTLCCLGVLRAWKKSNIFFYDVNGVKKNETDRIEEMEPL